MTDSVGARADAPGSREPSPAVSALPGFDPSRMDAAWMVRLLDDYSKEVGRVFKAQYPEFVAYREQLKAEWRNETPRSLTLLAVVRFAEAIATEARRAATTGAVEDEGAGPQDIAQPPHPNGAQEQ